ncbi:MAG TPA: choice-of-anchor Q domain-containing protein [Rudaea sp.]|jgi:hypothetical protein
MTLKLTSTDGRPRLQLLAASVALSLLGDQGVAATAAHPAVAAERPMLQALAGGRLPTGQNIDAIEAWLRRRAAASATGVFPDLVATTRAVSNCNDTGDGSLRSAVTSAITGDTVDMSSLGCSLITLTSGYLKTAANNLTVKGKTQQTLTIDGNYNSSVFLHTGTGTLAISDVTIRHGRYGYGGCIGSTGSVALTRVTVTACAATGLTVFASGGGIIAGGNLTMTSSLLSSNDAYDASFSGKKAYGGGALVIGNATISGSTINNNHATTSTYAAGGGLYVKGTLGISNSTISNNVAIQVLGTHAGGGGIAILGNLTIAGTTIEGNNATIGGGLLSGIHSLVTLTNSTVSNNTSFFAGGIASSSTLHLNNSTVALNYAGGNAGGAGVYVGADSVFQSTIIGHNYAGQGCTYKCISGPAGATFPADLSSGGKAITISGANNLIVSKGSTITVPVDTLAEDPMLASFLENNGGPTQTLALNALSPAIDKGNNVAGLGTDQRGPPFCRKIGAKPDIGAFEVQPAGGCGLIFADSFEAQ